MWDRHNQKNLEIRGLFVFFMSYHNYKKYFENSENRAKSQLFIKHRLCFVCSVEFYKNKSSIRNFNVFAYFTHIGWWLFSSRSLWVIIATPDNGTYEIDQDRYKNVSILQ